MAKTNGTFWPALGQLVYGLIRHGRLKPERIPEAIKQKYGKEISVGLLSRNAYSFTTTTSSRSINLENTIMLMDIQNDFSILKHIDNHFGFIQSRLPRVARNKKDTDDKINELQAIHLKVIECLLEYKRTPLAANRSKAIRTLVKSIESSTAIIRDLKYDFHQLEIPLFQ